MLNKLLEIEKKFEAIEASYNDPAVVSNPAELHRLGKGRAELEPIVTVIRDYQKTLNALKDTEQMLQDAEYRDLAQAELEPLREKQAALELKLKTMLVPKDPNDDRAVIIEVRPAAGGDEAAIFANELFRMYLRYAERKKWKAEIVEHEESGVGGIERAVAKIDHVGAYSQLKHESGVHRVQRVPATESQGRIHTSTCTVAVLPEAEDVDVEIKNDDLEISTYRSSSAGGQHMQKNETAIRVIHKPSGIVVTCQDQRSQQQNKLQALAVLRSKLYQAEMDRQESERAGIRKGQVGSGDRSEKIRTYNFPQSRITDHRIGKDMHNMITFMDGDIQEMIDALVQDEQARKLSAAEATDE
ncbi:MAG: peptide chain release factor 1 [Fimbriimonadaceae bacterium]|jgi:peptide chain release factor 1|nr:peptide chain release factor 1 [Fimbriimonadaceae bacterium]